MLLELIWLLFFRYSSISVAWFIEEVLQGSLSNFWIFEKKEAIFLVPNKILSLKTEVFSMLKLKVGNGQTCSLGCIIGRQWVIFGHSSLTHLQEWGFHPQQLCLLSSSIAAGPSGQPDQKLRFHFRRTLPRSSSAKNQINMNWKLMVKELQNSEHG